ncbi:MAG: hypothetical protein K8R08_09080 [Methanosarcinales archaeon]|nr:hypothetical protein [Methanosarcinales archaeon]
MNEKTDYLTEFEPAYLELVNSGEIDNRIETLYSKLEHCDIWHGLLIRHLVLPNNGADSLQVLEFIANEISRESYVNIMLQYRPAYRAMEFEGIDRAVYIEEYYNVLDMARGLGLHRGFPNE